MNLAESMRRQLKYLDLVNKGQFLVCMVCLGNICRSPMAAAILSNRLNEVPNLSITVDSAGTGAWHIGAGPNFESESAWSNAGYSYEHRAKLFEARFFRERDLILVMDSKNYRDVLNLAMNEEEAKKVFYLRQFDQKLSDIDPLGERANELEVPDPYGLGGPAFEKTLVMVEDSVSGLLRFLARRE